MNCHDDRGLWTALVGDGRPLILFTGLFLVLCGGFALFLALTGHFLPQDVAFLGMEAADLCRLNECRIVHFMIHDRVAFGGSLIAVGSAFMWLAEFPLRAREPWAWWTLTVSGTLGFASFLTYIGYGYFDSWHGAGTLVILPCFLTGMWRSRLTLPRGSSPKCLLVRGSGKCHVSNTARLFLILMCLGLISGGLVIMAVGMTSVFVPSDLVYIGITRAELDAINPRLIPLIAHDRAGFGGGVCATGLALLGIVWCGSWSRSLWQVIALAGGVGFASAIGVHFKVGYTDWLHLLPAFIGAVLLISGLWCARSALQPSPAPLQS